MVTFSLMEQPAIINLETVSFVVVEHSGQAACPGCQTVIAPAVQGIGGIALGHMVIPEARQNLIVPAQPGAVVPPVPQGRG